MANNTSIIKVDILGDASSATRSTRTASAAYDRLGKSSDKLTSASGRTQSKLGRLGSTVGTLAKRFGPLAAAAGAAGLVKFGVDAISAASDVQQAFGGIDAVFGKNAALVKKWAGDAATQVGLGKAQYADLANTLGASLKNTGIKDYTTQTQQLIKLGADLSATYGGSVADAVSAVSSLLRGETDPIEKYGVSINQTKVNSELLAKGVRKVNGQFTTQAQQTARLKLLFDQTSSAQGQFSKQTNTLAEQQQILHAKFTNLKAVLGQKLLPIATKVVKWLSDTASGTNKTSKVLRTLGKIAGSELRPIIAGFKSGLQQINTALGGSKGKTDGFKNALKVAASILRVIAPLVGKTVGGAFRTMGTSISVGIRAVRAASSAIQTLVGWLQTAWDWIGRVASKAKSFTLGGLGKIASIVRTGSDLPGLGRAGGMGLIGGLSVAAPQVSVSARPQVNVLIDGRALDSRMVRIVNSEMDRAAIQIRRKR